MNNVDLFEFAFIDRKEQAKKISNTLRGNSYNNVIWIYGKHGVGKSYFINHVIEKIPKEIVVHIELKAEDQSRNCMQLLLEKIEFITSRSFLSYFQKNYKLISKLVQGIICNIIENTAKIDINSLCDAILDSGKIFTDNINQQQNNIKLITSYIDSILYEQNLLIVIDNFALCDYRSFDLIISLLQYYSTYKKEEICFILCTSHEEHYNHIEYRLQEKVVLEPIEIEPFDDYKYFNDILIAKFNLATTTPHTIKQIFEFCQGYPERLKTFIHMLYSKGGIMFSEHSDRATWKDEIVENIIYENCHEYNVKDMTYIQQFILYIIVEFQKILSLKTLTDLVNYLKFKNLFVITDFSEQDTFSAIFELKQDGILTIYNEQGEYFVKMEHDLKYYSFREQFAKDPMMPKINGIFFEYVLKHEETLLKEGFSGMNIAELLAWHSYYGKVINWIHYNWEYGNLQYQIENYQGAAEIFCRFKECWYIFDNDQKIIIGKCFFHTGKYLMAKNVLQNVQDIKIDDAYDFFLLLAQVENMLFSKEEAVNIIDDNLIKYCKTDLQRLTALNLKQRILSNIKNKRKDAKEIFDNIKDNTLPSFKTNAIFGRFLMGTIEFYRGDIAEKDLAKAEQIAINTNNQYLLATLYTNKGFHEFWRGNIELAKRDFQKSQAMLSQIRIHETSYPLNNLGVCYMMEGEIDDAINCFQMGLLWNTSKYVEITLKTSLMACYAIKKNDSCFLLMEELLNILNDSQVTDISIHLKVVSVIGFVYKCYDDMGQYDEYKLKATEIASKCSSDTLPFIWFEDYSIDIEEYIQAHVNSSKYYYFYQVRFEPWLVSLNHD